MATAKLTYWDGRGKAELIRMTLSVCGIKFTETFLKERAEMLKLIEDNKLMFNQLPLLEIDGLNLVQSGATLRYVARKGGLTGKTEAETAQIDMLFEGGRDLYSPLLPMHFKPEEGILDEAKKTTLPKYLPRFERVAAANGTGFLVGNSLTLADLSLVEPLLVFVECLGEEIFNDYPALKKFFSTVCSHEKVSAYLKGPIRKRKNDDRYCKEVKTVLGW